MRKVEADFIPDQAAQPAPDYNTIFPAGLLPHPAPLNMEQIGSQSQNGSLSPNDRIKACLDRFSQTLRAFWRKPHNEKTLYYCVGGLACNRAKKVMFDRSQDYTELVVWEHFEKKSVCSLTIKHFFSRHSINVAVL